MLTGGIGPDAKPRGILLGQRGIVSEWAIRKVGQETRLPEGCLLQLETAQAVFENA